jgi:ATP-dependent Clp protease protease subunit
LNENKGVEMKNSTDILWGMRAEGDSSEPKKSDVVSPQKLTVESMNNHVYFYAGVDSDRCLALIKAIRDLDIMLRSERITRALPEDYPHTPIWLHIYSPGGSLFAGLGIADQLKNIRTPVYSIVEGYCASAATLISMACSRRYIMPSGFFLIHQISSFFWGTYEQFADEKNLLDMAMERLRAFYADHSKVSKEEISELLKRDSWFNAQQSLEMGFVDYIQNG